DKSEADRLLYPGRCRPVSLTSPPDGQGSLIVDAVGIGAFATDVIYRTRPEKVNGRLFVPVRGDATMHWIDVEDGGKLDCGQSANGGNCDDPHRVGDDPDVENTRRLRMPPEPFGIDATEDGRAIVISHQTEGQASLVVNDWASRSPVLEFVVPNLPKRPMGVAAIPEPELVTVQGLDYQPGFLLTFRDAAEI